MKKYLILFLLVFCNLAEAQFPVTSTVPARGEHYNSPITTIGKKYRITVEGTYSMWPQFSDCHGVDAGYVYDAPKEEMDAFRWPPDTIHILNQSIPFVTMPHWVGDDKLWSIPPKELGFTPKVEISFRKYKGFRIDGEPINNVGYNFSNHRYQIMKIGTGQPFNFQILDSNFDMIQENVIPRYEDNCGSLKVTIETVEETDLNICDIKPICDKGNQLIGIKLLASIFESDTNSSSGRRNLLQDIRLAQLGIVDNGLFRCDIDSISCFGGSTKSLSVGLLIDRSGSMSTQISETDTSVRMNASKKSITKFIDNIKSTDSAFVMSFSSTIILEQDWTNDKNLLKNAISKLQPEAKTSFYGAILQALDKTASSPSQIRTLLVLSDGCNTFPPDWDSTVLKTIHDRNIPIYIIALGLSSDACDIDGREKMEQIAKASNGKVFDVYNSKQLDSIYIKLSKSIASDDCCSIYFKIDSCAPGTERFVRIIYTPQDTVILTKVIKFKCDTCLKTATTVQYKENHERLQNISIAPNPLEYFTTISYVVNEPANVEISIMDIYGNVLKNISMGKDQVGEYYYTLDANSFISGIYIANIYFNGIPQSRKLVVIK